MKIKLFFIRFCMILFTSQIFSQSPLPTNISNNNELKILSWNIFMLPYISIFNNNGERAKAIAEKLHDSDYQIIVFQEAFSSKCRNILAKGLLKEYPYQYGPANKNILPFRTNSGLWIVSKIPLTQLGEIQFSVCKGFDAVARKGAVLFEGCINGSCFQLLATHLQADHSSKLRDKQCLEIKEHLLNTNFRQDTPQFICGDFNIDMDDSSNYQQMLQTLDAQNGELSGTVKVTYDEVNNNLAKIVNGKPRIIDYVLVRNGTFVRNVERKVQTFFSKIGDSESHLSDHYAMEFNVSFISSFDNATVQMVSTR